MLHLSQSSGRRWRKTTTRKTGNLSTGIRAKKNVEFYEKQGFKKYQYTLYKVVE